MSAAASREVPVFQRAPSRLELTSRWSTDSSEAAEASSDLKESMSSSSMKLALPEWDPTVGQFLFYSITLVLFNLSFLITTRVNLIFFFKHTKLLST